MKPKPSRILVPALLLAATVVVVLNAWFAFQAIDALLESEHRVEHTWQVINQVERIMSSVKDAETGNRESLRCAA
jgi:CHASE3 domain sensor protein